MVDFIESDGRADAGAQWLRAVEAGELVSAAQRNAFVAESAALMDALARPDLLLAPGAAVPSREYFGPVAAFNGRRVPLVGSIEAPAAWKRPGALPPSSGLFAAGSLGAALEPTADERRRLYLALYDSQKAMAQSFEVVRVERTAGVLPQAAVIVLALAGIAALAGVIASAVNTYIRESQVTARHAAQIQAASREYAQRLQAWAAARRTNPNAPMPPRGPNEDAVITGRAAGSAPPATRSATDALHALAEGANRALLVGAVGLGASVVLPPVLEWAERRRSRVG